MRSARIGPPKQFDFVDLDVPQAGDGDGQCLVKLERGSVCGSETRDGYGPIEPEEPYPMAPGRPGLELAGVMVESRTNAYHEGQRVVAIPSRGTGGLMKYPVPTPDPMILLDNRLEKSAQMGSTHAINPDRENLTEAEQEISRSKVIIDIKQ